MARLAGCLQIEAGDRITAGHDAVVRPSWLRHQHIFIARGLGLDDVAGRGSADFLVRREQNRDWQRRGESSARQLPDRFQRQVVAALHIEDARSEAFVALAPPGQLFQRANRVNRIEMPGDQNSGLALLRMRKPRSDAAAKTLPPGDAFYRRTHDGHVARGDVEHAIHRARIPGRAFAFHPAAQALQHGLGIKGKVGRVHDISLRLRFVYECRSGPHGANEIERGEFVK